MSTNDLAADEVKPGTNGLPPMITPQAMERHRIAGDRNIAPDADIVSGMSYAGQLRGSFKVCIDDAGRVADVTTIKSTTRQPYDARIIRAMKQWVFRPFVIDGRPIAACSAVTFIFTRSG